MGKRKSSSQANSSRQKQRDNDDDNSNKAKRKKTASGAGADDSDAAEQRRWPLSVVISDCRERWFKETLQEAKAGDVHMQVLTAQMYHCGYGVQKDADKGKYWMRKASRVKSSVAVCKVVNKFPGYTISDSDSDDINESS